MIITPNKVYVDVNEDSYEEGYTGAGNLWDMNLKGKYATYQELVENLEQYGFDSDYFEFEDGNLYGSMMTDVNGDYVDSRDSLYKDFKKGLLNLYSNDFQIPLSVVEDEHEMTDEEAERYGII